MSDGADGGAHYPGKTEDRVDKYHDPHDEQIQMVPRAFLL